MFCKKGVLKNFANFTGKNQYQNLFLIKLQVSKPFFKNTYFKKHLRTTASVISKITESQRQWFHHRTIIRTGITCKKIPLYLLDLVWLRSRARLAINRNISRYQTTNFLKTRFFFLVCKKGEKEYKSKFLTKCVGIIVAIIFM